MDATLIAIAMHSVERILAVFFGGLSVYFGFRLFLVLPTETHSDGKIKLPGMSVVLSKAAPGLFFVAFGVLVILASLYQPIKVKTPIIEYAGMTATAPADKEQRAETAAPRTVTEQDTVRVRLALLSINCMQRLSSARAKDLGSEFDQAAREAKLALLARVWNTKAWGDQASFEQWANGRAGVSASAAKTLFESERSDCPR